LGGGGGGGGVYDDDPVPKRLELPDTGLAECGGDGVPLGTLGHTNDVAGLVERAEPRATALDEGAHEVAVVPPEVLHGVVDAGPTAKRQFDDGVPRVETRCIGRRRRMYVGDGTPLGRGEGVRRRRARSI
jgi:hypothetical protein